MAARTHTDPQPIRIAVPAMETMACMLSATLAHLAFDGNGRTRALVARFAR